MGEGSVTAYTKSWHPSWAVSTFLGQCDQVGTGLSWPTTAAMTYSRARSQISPYSKEIFHLPLALTPILKHVPPITCPLTIDLDLRPFLFSPLPISRCYRCTLWTCARIPTGRRNGAVRQSPLRSPCSKTSRFSWWCWWQLLLNLPYHSPVEAPTWRGWPFNWESP